MQCEQISNYKHFSWKLDGEWLNFPFGESNIFLFAEKDHLEVEAQLQPSDQVPTKNTFLPSPHIKYKHKSFKKSFNVQNNLNCSSAEVEPQVELCNQSTKFLIEIHIFYLVNTYLLSRSS